MRTRRTLVLLTLLFSLRTVAHADELTEGTRTSYDRPKPRFTGLDLGFSMMGKEGGRTQFRHLGPYLRGSVRYVFLFSYATIGFSDASLEFRRRSLKIARAELSTRAVTGGWGLGADTEVGRARLALFAEGERTLWTDAVQIDRLRMTTKSLQGFGDSAARDVAPSYRWWLVRAGGLASVQLSNRIAPYATLGYLRFTATLKTGFPEDLSDALVALGVEADDVSGERVSHDTPAGSLGAIVTLTRAWAITVGAVILPLDDSLEEWLLATNAAVGRRF